MIDLSADYRLHEQDAYDKWYGWKHPHPDFMRLVEVDQDRCIGCDACAKICPWDTIFMIQPTELTEKMEQWTVRSVMYNDMGDNAVKKTGTGE